MTTKQLKAELLRKRKPAPPPGPADFVSTGCTVLNLACTGHRGHGFARGHFYWLVGDSTSGKTFLALTCFAEAARNKNFDKFRFIFDQPERGALMDFDRFFGRRAAARIEPPQANGEPSASIEDFYDNFDDAVRAGRPFIYVLDSHDALSSESEEKKFQEQKTARRKGREPVGSMGDGKAKKNSAGLRSIVNKLQKTGSILIVISQTRDNINPITARFNPKTYAGGRALKFYATLELWSSVRGKLKTKHSGKERQTGIICRVDVKKNRFNGRDRTVEFPIYHSVGIDDTGGCISYLVAEKHWKESGGEIRAPEFGYRGDIEGLLKKIESEGRESELRKICGDVWRNIEEACAVERKRRYD